MFKVSESQLRSENSVGTTLELTKHCVDFVPGLSFLHGQRIAHRDLSLENVLLTSSMQAKIADFGLAVKFNHEMIHHLGIRVGKTKYMCPEVSK